MVEGEWDWLHQGYPSIDAWQAANQSGIKKKPTGTGLRDKMLGPDSGYFGPGMMGAGAGGMLGMALGGSKGALPGALGGGALALLTKHLFGDNQPGIPMGTKPPINLTGGF
jgi:hypothetical protein